MNFFIKRIRFSWLFFPIFLFSLICLSGCWQTVYAQKESASSQEKPPLTLSFILKFLSEEKKISKTTGLEVIMTPAERNELILEGVRKRKIAFRLTEEIESQLKEAGAAQATMEAIRRESNILKGDMVKINNYAVNYLTLGDTAKSKRKFDEAIDNYNQVIELDPNNRVAFNQRGDIYRTLGLNFKNLGDAAAQQKNAEEASKNYTEANMNYDKAIEDFTKAISIAPKNKLGYFNRGVCYYEKPTNNNVEETKANARKAVDDFSEAIKIDPNFIEAYQIRANTYQAKLGEAAKAAADKQRIKEIKELKNSPTAQPVATDLKP